MATDISIEVSDLYADMYEEVVEAVGENDEVVRKSFENVLHRMYQDIESVQAEKEKQVVLEEPEDRQ